MNKDITTNNKKRFLIEQIPLPASTNLERESRQLQNALLQLEVELIKTDELLEILRDYMQESYILFFPFDSLPGNQIEAITDKNKGVYKNE